MTKIRVLLSILLSCTLLFLGAAAEGADSSFVAEVDDTTGIMSISGQISGCGYGDSISITILKPNGEDDSTDYTTKFITDIIDADMLAAYVMDITDADGAYCVEIGMEGYEPGDYKIIIKDSANPDNPAMIENFYFSSLKNKTDFIESVDAYVKAEGATSAGLAALLYLSDAESQTAKLFNIRKDSIIFRVTEEGFNKVAFEILKNTADLKEKSPSEFVAALEYSAKLRAFTEGVANVIDYAEEFELDSTFVETYKENLSETQKENFTKYFINKNLYTVEEVQKLFCDSVCLSIIQNPSGWSDYSSLIDKHGEYMGINMTSYRALSNPENVTNYLSNSYSTVGAFKEAVNTAITTLSGGSGSGTGQSVSIGSGPGSGTGSLGSGVSNGYSSAEVKVTGEVNDIPAPQTTDGSFLDLESVPWAVESIKGLVEKGIVNGVGGNMFDPDGDVLREQFVKMAVLAAGFVPEESETGFADVESGQWYSGYIASALKNNIINGISAEIFGVGENVTRQDAAAILYRIAGRSNTNNGANSDKVFADDSEIAGYAKEAVYALRVAGIINGREDNRFCPEEKCSRAEAAKMIYEFMRNFKE